MLKITKENENLKKKKMCLEVNESRKSLDFLLYSHIAAVLRKFKDNNTMQNEILCICEFLWEMEYKFTLKFHGGGTAVCSG